MGKAKSIITRSGETIIPDPRDIIRAQKDKVTDIASGTAEATKQAPGRFLESLGRSASGISVGDVVDMASGKRRVGDVGRQMLSRATDDATRDLRYQVGRVGRLPGEIKNIPRDVAEEIKWRAEQKKRQIEGTTIGKVTTDSFVDKESDRIRASFVTPDRSEMVRQNAVQSQLNDSAATIKTAKAFNKTLDKNSTVQATTVNNMINNVSKMMNTSSTTPTSGGTSNKLPLWRDIDSVLSGNHI